jgi:hypothetical protein
LALADNPAFRNALIAMRPKSTTSDLPTTYDVKVFLHNAFVKHMMNVKDKIMVSNLPLEMYLTLTHVGSPRESIVTADGWSADTTKMGFLGMTAHWIQVWEGKWKLKAGVIGFKALLVTIVVRT